MRSWPPSQTTSRSASRAANDDDAVAIIAPVPRLDCLTPATPGRRTAGYGALPAVRGRTSEPRADPEGHAFADECT
jgi:hypothetical protein